MHQMRRVRGQVPAKTGHPGLAGKSPRRALLKEPAASARHTAAQEERLAVSLKL